jgi:hypothetical protein
MFTSPKHEQLCQGMLMRILSVGLNFPNPELGCRKAALHLFVKQITGIDFWHQFDSGRCNFHLLMPALTLVLLLER